MASRYITRVKENWRSGLTVALVSIPMSVSLAVASGAAPVVGIITAVWGGLIASAISSSKFNIVGPAGALSGILSAYALLHGASGIPMLALVAGIFILIAYLLKLERYITFIPASTVHGFTLGVGLVLALGQVKFAFGLPDYPAHTEAYANLAEAFKHLPNLDWATTAVFAVFLGALFLFLKYAPRVPGTIVLTPIGILIGYLSAKGTLPFVVLTLGSKYADIKPALFAWHPFAFSGGLVWAGLTVAAVAILETMLCGKIADGMAGGKHDRHREMLGLSVANIVSGIFGGMPATAVLARTALNVKTGAKGRTSQGLNAIFMIVVSFVLLSTFKYIPLSVVAAILVFAAYRMIEQHHFIRMFKHDQVGFWISIAVAGVTVFWDPSFGILLGTVVALLRFLEKLSKGQYELIINDHEKKMTGKMSDEELGVIPQIAGDALVYSIKGQLAYLNAQAHVARFENSDPDFKTIILRMRELYFIDMDGIDAFEDIVEEIEKNGKRVLVTGVNPLIAKELEESSIFRRLETTGAIFNRTSDALKTLGYKVA